ncbi:MAG: hypothetical protein AVDCRST_MAG91-1803, partial [uncultured Sphingomonadaceae bacterium]
AGGVSRRQARGSGRSRAWLHDRCLAALGSAAGRM